MNKFKNRINYCLFSSTLLSKPSGTGNCVGRSMIEMLGVLAIIAVLKKLPAKLITGRIL